MLNSEILEKNCSLIILILEKKDGLVAHCRSRWHGCCLLKFLICFDGLNKYTQKHNLEFFIFSLCDLKYFLIVSSFFFGFGLVIRYFPIYELAQHLWNPG